MSNWQDTLHFSGKYLAADVQVCFLHPNTSVKLLFPNTWSVSSSAEQVVEATLERLPGLESVVMDTAFTAYCASSACQMSKAWYQLHGQVQDVPLLDDPVALKSIYHLSSIFLPKEVEEGRFVLNFKCQWEEEDGFAIRFHQWQIEETGYWATMLLI